MMKLWSSLALVGLLNVCMDPVLIVLIQPATGSGNKAIQLNPMKKVCGLMHRGDRLNISSTITIPQDQISVSDKLWFFEKCSIDLNKCGCPQQQDCYCSAKKDDDFSFIVNTTAQVEMKEQPFELTYGGKTFTSNLRLPQVYQKLRAQYTLNDDGGELEEMQTKIVDSAVKMTLCFLNLQSPTIIMTTNEISKNIKDGCHDYTFSPPTTVTVVYTETVGCKRNASYTVKLMREATLTKAGGGADDLTLICGKVTKHCIFKKDGHKILEAEGMEISGAVLTIKQADARNHLGSYTCEGTDSAMSSPVVITQSKLTGNSWNGRTIITCIKNSTEEGREFSYKLDGKTISGKETTLGITREGIYTCKSEVDDFDSDDLEYKKESKCNMVLSILLTSVLIIGFLLPAVYCFCNMRKKNRQLRIAAAEAKRSIPHIDVHLPAEGKPQAPEPAGSISPSDQSAASGQSSWFRPVTAESKTTGRTTQTVTTV